MSLLTPLVSFDTITADELDACLVAWGHKMGPLNRPPAYGFGAHGLVHDGVLVGVCSWSALVRENCAGMDFLPRETTTELSRVCASRRDLCRVMVRLWREFVFPGVQRARRHEWAVSYQDAHLHSGDLYRNDGWAKIGRFRSGGMDPRTGRKGRDGFVWGWHADPQARAWAALEFRKAEQAKAEARRAASQGKLKEAA